MKKLLIPILFLVPVTQAHAIDLTRAPTPDEVSKMGAIELCYHAEVRDTEPLSAKIKAEGLQCGPILESAKRILAAREAAAAEDRKQAEATKREQAERDRKAAAERKRQAELAVERAKRERAALIERKNQEQAAEERKLEERRKAAEQKYQARLAEIERLRQAQAEQARVDQERYIAAQQELIARQRAMEGEMRSQRILNGLGVFAKGLEMMNGTGSYAPPAPSLPSPSLRSNCTVQKYGATYSVGCN